LPHRTNIEPAEPGTARDPQFTTQSNQGPGMITIETSATTVEPDSGEVVTVADHRLIHLQSRNIQPALWFR
jgi:hypothetical protein